MPKHVAVFMCVVYILLSQSACVGKYIDSRNRHGMSDIKVTDPVVHNKVNTKASKVLFY